MSTDDLSQELSRVRLAAWLSVPAVFAFVAISAVAVIGRWKSESNLDRYRQQAYEAYGAGRFEDAGFFLQRLAGAGRLSQDDLFLQASALEAQGKLRESWSLMRQLAPDDSLGHPQAHRWMAVTLGRSLDELESLEPLGHHLDHALPQGNDVELLQVRVSYLLALEQPAAALSELERATDLDPRLLLALARLKKQLREDDADKTFRDAADYYRAAVEGDAFDELSRLRLAASLEELNQLADAVQILEAGVSVAPTPLLQSSLVELRMKQLDRFLRGLDAANEEEAAEKEKIARVMREVSELLELSPDAPGIYRRLESLYLRTSSGGTKTALRSKLHSLLTEGQSTALIHFCLGNLALVDEDSQTATRHFEMAVKQDPALANAMNNLAWMLLSQDEPDLSRSLELAEKAVASSPNDPRFLDTLGTVLLRLEKFSEAVTTLESVLSLRAGRQNLELHAKLAKAYSGLNMDTIADEHAKLSRQIPKS
ncbi:MAG: hypothetical protein ACE361_21250 [Aureliella sp.]